MQPRYTVTLTEVASDLADTALAWQREHLGAKSAQRTAVAVLRLLDQLAKQPLRYRRVAGKGPLARYRVAVVRFHRYVYCVDEEAKTVEIVFVGHERQNPETLARELRKL